MEIIVWEKLKNLSEDFIEFVRDMTDGTGAGSKILRGFIFLAMGAFILWGVVLAAMYAYENPMTALYAVGIALAISALIQLAYWIGHKTGR